MMKDYKRGIKLIRRLSKKEISKLKRTQLYTSLLSGKYLCGFEGPSCSVCCLHCYRLKRCYEYWLNGLIRFCVNRELKVNSWCSCVKDYIDRELKKEN